MAYNLGMDARVALIPPVALIRAVRRLLRPLVRLLLAHGVGYPYFANLAKAVFVEVAARDFPASEGTMTDSRVSLLSGVHRREVKRLRSENHQTEVPETVSMGAQLVARWCADPLYLDEDGRPKPLPRLARMGGDASFEALVAGVSKDIRPRAVLDEWLNLGVASVDAQDRVCLAEAAFIPAQGFDEKAFFLGKGIHDHLAAAGHNLLGRQPPFLDRMAYYNGLTQESLEELRQLGRELAMHALREFNRKALELQSRDSKKEDARFRVTFGEYFYAETEEQGRRDEA